MASGERRSVPCGRRRGKSTRVRRYRAVATGLTEMEPYATTWLTGVW